MSYPNSWTEEVKTKRCPDCGQLALRVGQTKEYEHAACFFCGTWNTARKHIVPITMEATKKAGSALDGPAHPAPERVQ